MYKNMDHVVEKKVYIMDKRPLILAWRGVRDRYVFSRGDITQQQQS